MESWKNGKGGGRAGVRMMEKRRGRGRRGVNRVQGLARGGLCV